ncbi:probable endochitinase [Ischnura elegans]|uniref:probable endochitinase n=1 Tax=Ischnura elegans TaxID=197161 RepID=UPI001ED87FA4|nr:probable endochitinase [Ischnura elegans]
MKAAFFLVIFGVVLAFTGCQAQSDTFRCLRDGLFPDPYECAKYYECHGGILTHSTCAPGEIFDAIGRHCALPSDAKCRDYHC